MNPFSSILRLSLLTIVALFSIAGCTVMIPATVQMQDAAGSSVNNMVVVEDLGVGFDYIHLDPEDMARNSVVNRGVRPRVFEFVVDPNPNHTIDIPVLGNQPPTRRNRVLGVDSETNPRFEWVDEARLVYSARDFQKAYQTSFSASGGAPITAAFSASASYGQVQQTTSSNNKMYVYKDGIFRGHIMELDPYYRHSFTESFQQAVADLDKGLQDTANYGHFIRNWGTHFSSQVTIGAKCSYRETITKEFASRNFQDNQQFQAEMSARMGVYEASFEGGTDRSSSESNEEATETANVRFISYGGSGAGTTSFSAWSDAAVVNSTLIDVELVSYLELFSSEYFPADTAIQIKHRMLEEALERYDNDQVAKINISESDTAAFFKDELITFKVEINTLICIKSKEWEDTKRRWRSQYWGDLSFELLDSDYRQRSQPILIFSRKLDGKYSGEDKEKNDDDYPLRLATGEAYELNAVKYYSVNLSEMDDVSISVTGQLKEMQNFGYQEFPILRKMGVENTVPLKSVDTPTEQTVNLKSTSNEDELKFTIRVSRVN